MATAAIENRWEVKVSRTLRGLPACRTPGQASQALRLPHKANLLRQQYATSHLATISFSGSPSPGPMYIVPDCARDARRDGPGKSRPLAFRRDRRDRRAAARCPDDVAKSECIYPDEVHMARSTSAIVPE